MRGAPVCSNRTLIPKFGHSLLKGHYSVKNSNGNMEEYAQPVPFKDLKSGPKSETLLPNLLPEPENLVPKLRRPKPLNSTKHTLKEIEDANYNPFNQNYAILSPSRYSCNCTKRKNKNKLYY